MKSPLCPLNNLSNARWMFLFCLLVPCSISTLAVSFTVTRRKDWSLHWVSRFRVTRFASLFVCFCFPLWTTCWWDFLMILFGFLQIITPPYKEQKIHFQCVFCAHVCEWRKRFVNGPRSGFGSYEKTFLVLNHLIQVIPRRLFILVVGWM